MNIDYQLAVEFLRDFPSCTAYEFIYMRNAEERILSLRSFNRKLANENAELKTVVFNQCKSLEKQQKRIMKLNQNMEDLYKENARVVVKLNKQIKYNKQITEIP